MSKEEYIGKVKIDLSYYSEKNDTSDIVGIDDLLSIVANHDGDSFDDVIKENNNWMILYNLSPYRENLISWLSIKNNSTILEIGSECGALTGLLSQKAISVHAIDPSYKACKVNALRHSNYNNLKITAGNYKEVLDNTEERYDYITILNYKSFEPSSLPLLRKHLSDEGKIIICADNKLGLRYLSGYEGNNSSGFTKSELENEIKKYGISDFDFYYPYPDSVFPSTIYSDEYLPKKGELNDNLRNFDKDRYVFWNEARIFDNILEEGVFPSFSNSFLLIIGKSTDEKILYVKISDNRDVKYQIVTKIIRKNGRLIVTKNSKHPEVNNWIFSIKENEDKLSELCNPQTNILKSTLNGDVLEYNFVNGVDLETEFDNACSSGDVHTIYSVLDRYYQILRFMKSSNSFTMTQEFINIFGKPELNADSESGTVVNIDLLMPNVFYSNGEYTIIDCEWVFCFPIPIEYVFWRALTFSRSFSRLNNNQKEHIYNHYGLTDDKRASYLQMENAFQSKVAGDTLRVSQYHSLLQRTAVPVDTLKSNSNKITALEQEVESLRKEIGRIKQSKSWRLLKFFRIVK